MLGRISASYIRSQPSVAAFRINIRALSDVPDVEVENYRNEWKTYGDIENYTPGKFTIQTFNKISTKGLKLFEEDKYEIRATGEGNVGNAHAVLLRSHKLQESEIMHTVRAIARCGAGTNNIPVARCTELGIPVFNTPGANANAVKELVIAGMFLGSRRVIDGINHMKELGRQGLAKERVEKDKSKFGDTGMFLGSRRVIDGINHMKELGRQGLAKERVEKDKSKFGDTGMFLGSRRVIDGINHMKELGRQGLAKERVEKDKSKFGGREIMGKTLAVIGLGHIGASTARDAAALGMDVIGYDPALSISSALKLPNKIALKDSIGAAVANADYISINIPYIKGENGTHGIIGKDIIKQFKQGAVLLNFARGELVDSEAMKEFLDNGDGRYVSDFPDDLLWDHQNAIILPHLGASTAEAEDAAAAMAAETIKCYLENGTIKNSVNFPATSLPNRPEGAIRMTVINKNQPGMLARITEIFAESGLNIFQQVNQSKGGVAYNVLDIDTSGHKDVISFKKVQEKITMLDGVMSSRILYGTPGTGYAKNLEGQYFV
eukprot:CAMPEP_0176492418 /NCGR_PEP_ID=MMETSP0200_2-20121128/8985_1 /TAXON_ID=947934 /ORGANISM="Chaetoceros sp., Strain GSL56" /LENGTH=549 /DNA_ID=CAMNT_0017889973 /DNA_START=81 /DNA_END=1732 /DNA_ORIENTATION=+